MVPLGESSSASLRRPARCSLHSTAPGALLCALCLRQFRRSRPRSANSPHAFSPPAVRASRARRARQNRRLGAGSNCCLWVTQLYRRGKSTGAPPTPRRLLLTPLQLRGRIPQGQSVWIYGTSLRKRAVRDKTAAPRRGQLPGAVPRGATPHTDGAVRPSRSISQSTRRQLS
eukprot:COSAG06_NODE_7604_length_2443_cov_17.405717_3_plen_172_part_00